MPNYNPSPRDILHVSALLSCTPLPPELIDIILEYAEYWARITTRLDSGTLLTTYGGRNEHCRLLRVKPICSAAADGSAVQYTGSRKNSDRISHEEQRQPPIPEGIFNQTINVLSGVLSGAATVLGFGYEESDSDSDTEGLGTRAEHYATLPASLIPEPRGKHPVRRITWKLSSKDQGWGGEGGTHAYENSWTGFRGVVSRFKPKTGDEKTFDQRTSEEYLEYFDRIANSDHAQSGTAQNTGTAEEPTRTTADGSDNDASGGEEPVPAPPDQEEVWPRGDWCFKDTHIQVNRRANRSWFEHEIVWDYRDDIDINDPRAMQELKLKGRGCLTGDGSQVRALARGDMIELWSYAFFPGWSNNVQHAEVVVEFAL